MSGDFWIRIALAAAVILGIWNALAPDMIFGRVGDWLEKYPWVGKPLGLCPPCMASVHGTWIFFFTDGHWTDLPVFILALSGIMTILARNFLDNGKEHR